MKASKSSAKPKRITVKRAAVVKPRPARVRAAASEPKAGTKSKRSATKSTAKKKRGVRRTSGVVLPRILLEGDEPAPLAVSGPGEKFALGPTPPAERSEAGIAELPETYGTQRLYLTARDPHWLYANWDVAREQQLRFNHLSADGHLILRIYADAPIGKPVSEIHVHPESRHWFANVERAGAKYAAEIGYYRKGRAAAGGERRWTSVAKSGATLTPAEMISSEATTEFATIPMDLPFGKLLTLVAQAARQYRPLAQAVEELRRAGHPELPRVDARPAEPWTPEQERALAEIVNLDQVRRVWIGSLEVTELVRRQLGRGISPIGAVQFGLPTSPGGVVADVSSPFGGEQGRGKSFWFSVNAELIVYGATEPTASVTIGGRSIQLRSDGSFAYRFALPDGRYDLPVVAVSADDADARAAELKFTRTTEYLGEVGAHPQDPALKSPTPDNV